MRHTNSIATSTERDCLLACKATLAAAGINAGVYVYKREGDSVVPFGFSLCVGVANSVRALAIIS